MSSGVSVKREKKLDHLLRIMYSGGGGELFVFLTAPESVPVSSTWKAKVSKCTLLG
jgi:hypothetical protein